MGMGAKDLSVEEAGRRAAQKQKIVNALSTYQAGIETLPGLGPHPGFAKERLLQIRIPEVILHEVTRKMVRGCEYVLGTRIVEMPYEIEIFFPHENNVPEPLVRMSSGTSASETHLGPGFRVIRAAAQDDPYAVWYKITLWGTFTFYAAILPR